MEGGGGRRRRRPTRAGALGSTPTPRAPARLKGQSPRPTACRADSHTRKTSRIASASLRVLDGCGPRPASPPSHHPLLKASGNTRPFQVDKNEPSFQKQKNRSMRPQWSRSLPRLHGTAGDSRRAGGRLQTTQPVEGPCPGHVKKCYCSPGKHEPPCREHRAKAVSRRLSEGDPRRPASTQGAVQRRQPRAPGERYGRTRAEARRQTQRPQELASVGEGMGAEAGRGWRVWTRRSQGASRRLPTSRCAHSCHVTRHLPSRPSLRTPEHMRPHGSLHTSVLAPPTGAQRGHHVPPQRSGRTVLSLSTQWDRVRPERGEER